MLRLWIDEYLHPTERVCGLCGNTGVVDTRGRVTTAQGVDCGIRAYCLCPNGREIKRQGWPLDYDAPHWRGQKGLDKLRR